MKKIDLTLSTPAENLAFDEVLLDLAEEGKAGEILRFWQPREYFVVLGYSDKIKTSIMSNPSVISNSSVISIPSVIPSSSVISRSSVISSEARNLSFKTGFLASLEMTKGNTTLSILRRCSGGGTVVQGPGCLNYALILKIQGNVTQTNRAVMEKHREALEKIMRREVTVEGHTDLVVDSLKFSGNAQRRKKTHLLFHGTFLLNFDLTRIEKTLTIPEKQPAYRKNRPHKDFLTNIGVPADKIKKTLEKTWQAEKSRLEIPHDRIQKLAAERYDNQEWNTKY
ncbi:MAG: hypothetical protein HY592_00495 [Candidatus Omnitrophica bacterium]|nr:hypothetical protein [Candidatus Omnitrophota bacterium]